MDYKSKKMVEGLYPACEKINEAQSTRKEIPDGSSLIDVFKEDCINFLLYLSASDGRIVNQEAHFINALFDTSYTSESMNEKIQRENLYSSAFEKAVPTTLKCFVIYDNKQQTDDKRGASCSEQLYYTFEKLGKEFIACDDNVADSEIDDLTIYLTMLKQYINTNCNFQTSLKGKVSIRCDKSDDELSLQDLLNELDELTGLNEVKKDVNSLINLQQIQQIRLERGLKPLPVSLHLVFTGNPGTGKTTVARLLAQVYNKLGILSKGQFIEVDRSGLIAGYVGQTALKVQEVIQSALGGVLFIDEAYALTNNPSGNDYGHEAVETLLKAMEDNRDDLVVIVAGYPDLMAQFLASNPGLRSRFNKFIHFSDYNSDELYQIFEKMCRDAEIQIDDNCRNFVSKVFERKVASKDKTFANGREVRNYFEKAIVNQANRLVLKNDVSNSELTTLILADVQQIGL